MDAGRFQRLHESGGKPERHAIVRPEILASAAGEADRARIGESLAIKIGEQDRRGFVVRHEPAAIDVAVSGTMLQRNSPLPAGRLRTRLRIRPECVAASRTARRARNRTAASCSSRDTGTPRVLPSSRLRNPVQSMKKLPGTRRSPLSVQGRDIAAFAVAFDVSDHAFNATDSALLCNSRAALLRKARRRNDKRRRDRESSSSRRWWTCAQGGRQRC